jgi:Methyltransferase domain.
MESYGPATYGDHIADVYDERHAQRDPAAEVARISELAGAGPVLELGIGTGRVAVPLAARGVEVHGIDASEAMVARLRTRAGGDAIPVAIGDMQAVAAPGDGYSFVYVVFNTFFGLLTQDDQVECFRAIARHLTDDGVFAMEAFVPDQARFDRGQRVSAVRVEPDVIDLEVTKNDPIAQSSVSQHVVIREDGIRLFPVKIRYAFVAELDLMARLAGLRLRERWGDWDRSPRNRVTAGSSPSSPGVSSVASA